jgi:1-phosphofructokinase family hexose kinase
MIITVTLNSAIDKTLSVPNFRLGRRHRTVEQTTMPGGKGVNVARVARALRVPAVLVGFTPGRTGAAAAQLLVDEGLRIDPVPTGGELRSTAVIMERGGRVTVINEPGPAVGPEDWERYEAAVSARLERNGVLVCSGSVPPGTPSGAYGRLVELAADAGATAIVDTSGVVLEASLQSRPAVVCPNLAEAEGLLHGRPDETVEAGDPAQVRARATAAAVELVQRGARAAVVTAGAAGAAVAEGSTVGWHEAHTVTVRNPIGAGDALAGGLAAALERGEPLARAVRAGLATAAASVETATAGEIEAVRAAELEAAAVAR